MDPLTAKILMNLGLSVVKSKTFQRVVIAVICLQAMAISLIVLIPMIVVTGAAGGYVNANAAGSNCDSAGSAALSTQLEDGGGKSFELPKVNQLSSSQVSAARTMYITALAVGAEKKWSTAQAERAATITLAVGFVESQLGTYPGWESPNGDGDAGYLQQRTYPGWYGTVAQVNDPAYAARIFLLGKVVTKEAVAAAKSAGITPAGPVGYTIPGLVQVKGWENLEVTIAAQKVQRSAFPDAYAKYETSARSLVTVFRDNVDPASVAAASTANTTLCGPVNAMDCPATSSAAEAGLQPDTLRVIRCVHKGWPIIKAWAGVGDRPSNVDDDHQTGRALDVMIPDYQTAEGKALGQDIADWVVKNRSSIGMKYVIWNEHIWSTERKAEGWRLCGSSSASCYNGPDDTAAHRDHVHVSTYGDTAGDDTLGPNTGTVSPPVTDYTFTATFGQCSSLWANCHTGLDFALPGGKPIYSVMSGSVTASGSCGCAYGNLTKIKIDSNTEIWYAHQLSQSVTVGQKVSAGQEIGRVGETGNAFGAHLHLEVRIDGKPVDPKPWLQKRGAIK